MHPLIINDLRKRILAVFDFSQFLTHIFALSCTFFARATAREAWRRGPVERLSGCLNGCAGYLEGFSQPERNSIFYHISLLTNYEQGYILAGMIERVVQEVRKGGGACHAEW